MAATTADDRVEIDWIPSADDGRVTAYGIYRNGQLVGEVGDDPDVRVEFQRHWRTTTWIDCNYTKDIDCTIVGRPQPGTRATYTVVRCGA